ncbi:MAG: YcxB family protein [Oscillospiraceae bacterium]|jgi:hypothetical protein|nr:YcxB family protein [Oscillospiraceae bacterium]MCI8714387.1 YcxB family protein [Oscillospiraceae bacterium]MCI9317665.1 YcxB family protein [Oscillospiraceae bacterium]
MNGQWDFTIGLRETRDLYLLLMREKWRGGILGFGAAGALTAVLYTGELGLSPPLRAAAVLAGAGLVMLLAWAALTLSTAARVRGQLRRSGRESYVQQTRIDGFGVHVTVGKDQARLGFDKLARVRETRRAFYLFIAGSQAWILPKGQMEEGDCARIRELFRSVIERGRLKLAEPAFSNKKK